MKVGIDQISFYTPGYYYPLESLACDHGIDPNKYLIGVGQENMSVPSPDEDIVTMAANAAENIMTDELRNSITMVLLATESGVDRSKSAGVFVHGLLGLNSECRVVEFKQACYSGTAALQLACDSIRVRPNEKILVIASDIAKYDQKSSAEVTQGAGAVAMLITQNPRIAEIHKERGFFTADVMDFFRPNHSKTGVVDVKLSLDAYMNALKASWKTYGNSGGKSLKDFPYVCFHQPFTKMAEKALRVLKEVAGEEADHLSKESISDSLIHTKNIGNTYTASLYIGLSSLLDNNKTDMSGIDIGLYSYGSGSVAEFFSATIVGGYKSSLSTKAHNNIFDNRIELTQAQYQDFYYNPPSDALENQVFPSFSKGTYRLEKIEGFKRCYAKTNETLSLLTDFPSNTYDENEIKNAA